MSQLHCIQQLFMKAIFESNNVNTATDKLAEYLKHKKDLSPQQQIAICRDSVFGSLSLALSQIYPVCRKLVGDEFFDFMATQYIKKHYSVSPDLADFGKQLAIFIEAFKPLSELVYLADVARLEWAWHKAFHAVDYGLLDIYQLAQVPETDQPSLLFMLPPGSELISSIYPIDVIWLANQGQNKHDQVISLDQGGVKLLVWRKQYDMRIDTLHEDEWLFLNAIKERQSFIGICDYFENDEKIDITTLMPRCVQYGWIADFTLGVNE
ncbi:MAG: putative DNA-binding domain-containing protein [Gammaproteobacteria bacterium]